MRRYADDRSSLATAWSSPGTRVRLEKLDTGGDPRLRQGRGVSATRRQQLDPSGRPPGPVLGRGQALRAGRPPGHRRGRQGRHDQQGHGGVQPAGLPGHLVQGARAPRSSPTTTCGGSTRRVPRQGRDRDLQSLALRGRAGRPGPRPRARSRSGRSATTRSTPSSGRLADSGTTIVKFFLSIDRGRAARAVPGPLRRPDQALEVLDGRPRGAQALGRLPGRLRRRAVEDLDGLGARGTSSRPTASGSATWPWRRSWPTRSPGSSRPTRPARPAAGPRHRVPRRIGRLALAGLAAAEERPEDATDDVLAEPRGPPCRRSGSRCRSFAGAPAPRPRPPSPGRRRWRSAARRARAARSRAAWRSISRCCWAGVIVFRPDAVVGSTPARAWPRRPRPGGPAASRAGDPLVGAVAVDRRAVLGLSGLVAIRPRNWTSSIGAISESGASRRVAASGVGTPRGERTVTSASPVPSEVIVFSTS